MKPSFRTKLWLLLPLAFVAFLMSPWRGNVCISQFRLADKQQQIEAALDYYESNLTSGKELMDPQKKWRKVFPEFTSVENFKARFPNCCKVLSITESNGWESDWLDWMTGIKVVFVSIKFDVPYLGDNGEALTVAHDDQIPVSSCGTIRTDVFYQGFGHDFAKINRPKLSQWARWFSY